MTRREEIRKGIEQYTNYPAALWAYLHENGVVLKVGEITENLAQTASQSNTYAAAGQETFMLSSERTSHIFKAFKDMGYVAVKPLIKEK